MFEYLYSDNSGSSTYYLQFALFPTPTQDNISTVYCRYVSFSCKRMKGFSQSYDFIYLYCLNIATIVQVKIGKQLLEYLHSFPENSFM